MARIDLDITLNGQRVTQRGIDEDMMLVDFLREELGLTGTKFCCGIAVCRVCTVAVSPGPGGSEVPARACTTPLSEINGRTITTVEGLGTETELHPLPAAFLRNFSFQCGYCCPGFLMASYALLDRLRRQPIPLTAVDAAIQDSVGQHICRCTGYVRYHRAIREVVLATPGLVL